LDVPPIEARGLKAMPPRGSDIYVEFVTQGAFVKATAIHAATGTEASIIGPAGAARVNLSAAAIRKLEYVLKKQKDG
jgi:hypothetical protein